MLIALARRRLRRMRHIFPKLAELHKQEEEAEKLGDVKKVAVAITKIINKLKEEENTLDKVDRSEQRIELNAERLTEREAREFNELKANFKKVKAQLMDDSFQDTLRNMTELSDEEIQAADKARKQQADVMNDRARIIRYYSMFKDVSLAGLMRQELASERADINVIDHEKRKIEALYNDLLNLLHKLKRKAGTPAGENIEARIHIGEKSLHDEFKAQKKAVEDELKNIYDVLHSANIIHLHLWAKALSLKNKLENLEGSGFPSTTAKNLQKAITDLESYISKNMEHLYLRAKFVQGGAKDAKLMAT